MADESASATGWVLPEKYSKDLKDENGEPLSKSEFKKRQKAAEKAKKAAEKAAARKANPLPTKKKKEVSRSSNEPKEPKEPKECLAQPLFFCLRN